MSQKGLIQVGGVFRCPSGLFCCIYHDILYSPIYYIVPALKLSCTSVVSYTHTHIYACICIYVCTVVITAVAIH